MDKIAFLIPSTSKNRQWDEITDSYLYHTLSILNKYYNNLTIYIGFDTWLDILEKEEQPKSCNIDNPEDCENCGS